MPNSYAYMRGRQKYQRPQGVLWSENSGTLVEDPESTTTPKQKIYIPTGIEIGADPGLATGDDLLNQFLILSDDNRSAIDFKPTRIEKRERMINGRMRSYHIADKLSISLSWENLPSRSHGLRPSFGSSGKTSLIDEGLREAGSDGSFSQLPNVTIQNQQYTTDGGAGGAELLDWYENHQGSFWMFLSYDKYTNFGSDNKAYGHLPQYNQLIEVFFSDFKYTVSKRGNIMDLWNVDVTLEEV
jgi:hypothetical protein